MGQSYFRKNDNTYIAELNGGKCRTYSGFVQELLTAFSVPYDTDNLNDVNYYIFADWKYQKKILFKLENIELLKKKDKQYKFVIDTLQRWKEFHEEYDGFSILIEE